VTTRWHYTNWNNHRPWPPLVEGKGWARKLRQRKQRAAETARVLALISEPDAAPFSCFRCNFDSDAQILLHSPFSGMTDALEAVIGSFAAHAPAEARLLVKEHPLDNWVHDWRGKTFDIGRAFGVAERIDYLPGGDIVPVARRSLGMVTIDGASGTLGLMLGKPVVVLGSAVYDIPDITCQDGLDAFWRDPAAPDPETFAAFRRVLIDRCLIREAFLGRGAGHGRTPCDCALRRKADTTGMSGHTQIGPCVRNGGHSVTRDKALGGIGRYSEANEANAPENQLLADERRSSDIRFGLDPQITILARGF